MLRINAIPSILLSLILAGSLPGMSYAGDQHDGHGRHDHDGHHYYRHRNPDLTLVSGMENIDPRVLIASSDQTEEVTDQAAPGEVITTASQVPNPYVYTDFIVNVPNKTGGYTPIRIQKSGSGYIGPQGELYYPFPEISQLKAMYRI